MLKSCGLFVDFLGETWVKLAGFYSASLNVFNLSEKLDYLYSFFTSLFRIVFHVNLISFQSVSELVLPTTHKAYKYNNDNLINF